MEMRIISVRFVYADFTTITCDMLSLLLGTGEWMGYLFPEGNVSPAFQANKEGQRAFPVSAISQLPLTENNHYAKVVYLGMTYSDPLQWLYDCTGEQQMYRDIADVDTLTINGTPYPF